MQDHENSDRDNFDDIRNSLQRIEIQLSPVFETYSTVSQMGKWVMAVAVFASVLIGIILSVKTIFMK